MRQIIYTLFILLACACEGNNRVMTTDSDTADAARTTLESDSTLYGICASNLSWDRLTLITSTQDRIQLKLSSEGEDSTQVIGGLNVGDRLAVIARGNTAQRIINLTSLIGTWRDIAREITLNDDGDNWRILNGRLLIHRDTFTINTISASELELENDTAIYIFNRN